MSDLIQVDLSKAISGKLLKDACITVAEKMGYVPSLKDKPVKRYYLGSTQEQKGHTEISILLLKNSVSKFSVNGIREGEEQNHFYINLGWPDGYASSNEEVKEYLSVLSKYL